MKALTKGLDIREMGTRSMMLSSHYHVTIKICIGFILFTEQYLPNNIYLLEIKIIRPD